MDVGLHEGVVPIDGREVRYTLVVPGAPGPRPIVVALHYAGHGAPHYATDFVRTLVEPGLRDLDALIVAPDCPGASWSDPVSEKAVLALVDLAARDWRGDPARVVVTGFSMGGMGTWWLAERHPDRFVAAIPIAGRPSSITDYRVATYAIHGEQDELIAPGPSRAAIRDLAKRGIDAVWTVVPEATHYQTSRYAPALSAAVPWIRAHLGSSTAPTQPP